MSPLRNIVNGVGVIVTVFGIYKVQKIVSSQMKDSNYSADTISSSRAASVFVTSVVLGGLIDKAYSI